MNRFNVYYLNPILRIQSSVCVICVSFAMCAGIQTLLQYPASPGLSLFARFPMIWQSPFALVSSLCPYSLSFFSANGLCITALRVSTAQSMNAIDNSVCTGYSLPSIRINWLWDPFPSVFVFSQIRHQIPCVRLMFIIR